MHEKERVDTTLLTDMDCIHHAQLDAAEFPRHLRTVLFDDLEKGETISDSLAIKTQGGRLSLLCIAMDGVAAESEVLVINHAWTFRPGEAKAHLESDPDLVRRMVAMMHPGEPYNNERDRIEAVLDAMWPFVAGTYTAGEDGSVWYVLDEAGSAVRHSDNPSAKMIPFVYYTGACEEARICSILWPIRNLSCGETVTRDFLPRNLPEGDDAASLLRQARLCAFEPVPPELKERCRAELAAWRQSLAAWGEQGNAERGVGRNAAAVDAEERNADRLPSMARPDGTPLKVFSELPYVAAELTRPEFEMVDDAGAADIIWASRAVDAAFKAAVGGLKPGCVVSQFPYEGAIVLKHHLASTVAREFGDRGFARQIPATYTLPSQLLAFMADFWERAEREGSPNFWVLKPCDLARSKGTVVCGNLAQALRQLDLGPRVVQSYVAAPLLFRGRKVDLRVVALLRSARPLELYAYDRFWPRVAARPYDCSSATALADQRVSLTAMHLLNGGDGGGGGGGGGGDGDGGGNDGDDRGDGGCSSSRVSGAEGKSGFHHHVDETEFVAEIEATHPGVCWADVMRAIHAIIRAVFVAAARQQPGMASAESRAIYGCDIILTEDLEPRLLEVSFCPGNLATSPAFPVEYSRYVDDVFGCLFLGEKRNVTRLL